MEKNHTQREQSRALRSHVPAESKVASARSKRNPAKGGRSVVLPLVPGSSLSPLVPKAHAMGYFLLAFRAPKDVHEPKSPGAGYLISASQLSMRLYSALPHALPT